MPSRRQSIDSSRQPNLPGMDDEPDMQISAAGEQPSSKTMVAETACPVEPADVGETPALAGKSVWCIDVNNLVFQVFHAIPQMTSPRGEPVNAVYGFTRDLLYLIDEKRPDYLLAAMDLSGPTFRHNLYVAYKENRSEVPDELAPQFPKVRAMIEALGIPLLECEGFEADDILATIARVTEELGGECVVVTSDKDCRQLITDRVRLYNIRKDQYYDEQTLAAEWGVLPSQVVDFQALVGDSTDNVPGVPLIGPKAAKELLATWPTLDQVLAHADEVKGVKRRQNLIEYREQALVSQQLVRLDANVAIDLPWAAARVGAIDTTTALSLCQEFGFRRFAEQLRSSESRLIESRPAEATTAAPQPAAWQADYRTIDTPDKFERFLAELREQNLISFDVETTDLSPRCCEIVGYAIAWEPGRSHYIPVRAPKGDPRLDPLATIEALRPVLEDPDVAKIGQNLKYDMVALRCAGVEIQGVTFDTMLASYLLEAGERNHDLDSLAQRYLNHQNIKIKELIGSGKNQKRMDEVPVPIVTDYAAEDADVPLRLMPLLEPPLHEAGLYDLFREVEVPLIEVLAELEFNGIRVDVPRLQELGSQHGERLERLEREIYELAGREFNVASPKQLQVVLFEEQGLPVMGRTAKTGPRTDSEVLEELAVLHPLPAKIIEHRQFAKLKGTYIDALPELVNPATGRVHCSFHQVVAATGRLSSSNPNLQNIPVRTQEGREIRSAFLADPPGWLLLASDYSQIELRVLAHYSQDETLCQAFACDEDVHSLVASQVFGVPREEVTSAMRRTAKAVNFGVIYGQSPFGLAKALKIEKEEAARFIDAYFERYPGVDEFLAKILADAKRKGYVDTVLGRRRAIHGIRSQVSRQRNLPERIAVNTVIQGSAADLIKLAMLRIHGRLRRQPLDARMLLQIHDELIFEVSPEHTEALASLVREEMAGVMNLRVPLKVDMKTGSNWAETEPWN